MGIRVALGGLPSDIVWMVVRETSRPLVVGALAGLGIATLAGQLVASQLYGLTPHDPAVLAVAAVTLLVIGTLACLAPALRATRASPITALRLD